MPQVIIRRPFGELGLCDQLRPRTEYDRRLEMDGEISSIRALTLRITRAAREQHTT